MPIGEDSPLKAHAFGAPEAVDSAAALGNKKARLAGRAFCFIGTSAQAAMVPPATPEREIEFLSLVR